MRVLHVLYLCSTHVPYEVCGLSYNVRFSDELNQDKIPVLWTVVLENNLAKKWIKFCAKLLWLERRRLQVLNVVLYTVLRLEQLFWKFLDKLGISRLIAHLKFQSELPR